MNEVFEITKKDVKCGNAKFFAVKNDLFYCHFSSKFFTFSYITRERIDYFFVKHGKGMIEWLIVYMQTLTEAILQNYKREKCI